MAGPYKLVLVETEEGCPHYCKVVDLDGDIEVCALREASCPGLSHELCPLNVHGEIRVRRAERRRERWKTWRG